LPGLTFVLPHGRRVTTIVPRGSTVLEAARIAGVAIEGACGGSMACATCHVHVEAVWFGRVAPPSPEEEDMLDFALELARTSRLGCQIQLADELDGLVVRVPASSLCGAGR
jgi:ferredoxin, 2Fe-2S